MKRWTHLHSLLTGGAGGLMFAGHAWMVFALGLLLGLALSWAWRTGWRLANRVDRALPDATRTRPELVVEPEGKRPVGELRTEALDRIHHDLSVLAAYMPRQRGRR